MERCLDEKNEARASPRSSKNLGETWSQLPSLHIVEKVWNNGWSFSEAFWNNLDIFQRKGEGATGRGEVNMGRNVLQWVLCVEWSFFETF